MSEPPVRYAGSTFAAYVPAAPSQERALRANVDIVVATPGRLMDHMRHESTDFSGLEVLVLDEADRMLDMGFWPDVQRILAALPAARQTLLFSATMPAEVMKLTHEFLREPRYVQVGRRGGPAQTISHAVQSVPAREKTQWLARWLREEATGPVLVFCRTKIGADRLASRLSGLGIRTTALHADRTQQQRMAAVEGFRTGMYPVLVATDVAARGLDIEGIAHVVNYEVPDTPENRAFKAKVLPAVQKYAQIGIRIEDSFLLTDTGLTSLSASVPRTIAEIEAFMKAR